MTRRHTVYYLALGITLTLLLLSLALRQNLNHFCETSEIVLGEKPITACQRIGGIVEKGSLKYLATGEIEFRVTDTLHAITVRYEGLLPDLFREGQGIIAVGKLTTRQHFEATQVLAKHDEYYKPITPKALRPSS